MGIPVLIAAIWFWPESPVAQLPALSQFIRWTSNGEFLTALVRPVEGEWIAHRWEISTGRQIVSFPLDTSGMELRDRPLVLVSPTGTHVALGRRPAGGDLGAPLRVWNVSEGTLWREFSICGGDYFVVRPLAFSGDGEWLAIQALPQNEQPVIEVWRVGESRPQARLSGCHAPLALSYDGQRLAAVDGHDHPCLIDAATGEVTARFANHTFPVALLAFSRDGLRLASAGNRPLSDQDLRPTEVALHDVNLKRTIRSWNLPQSLLADLSFEANDRCLCAREALASTSSTWNISEEIPDHAFESLGNPVIAPDGWRQAIVTGDAQNLMFAVAFENPQIEIVDNRTGSKLRTLPGDWPPDSLIQPIAFSPDGETLGVRVGRPRLSNWWLPFGGKPTNALDQVWETWLVDSASGKTKGVFPGRPLDVVTPNPLFVAPDRLLLGQGFGLNPTVSASLWNARPFPRRSAAAIAAILSGLFLAWHRRRRRVLRPTDSSPSASPHLTGEGVPDQTRLR